MENTQAPKADVEFRNCRTAWHKLNESVPFPDYWAGWRDRAAQEVATAPDTWHQGLSFTVADSDCEWCNGSGRDCFNIECDCVRQNTGLAEKLESLSETIYNSWSTQPGFVPWITGGKSLKQIEARQIASRTFELALANQVSSDPQE